DARSGFRAGIAWDAGREGPSGTVLPQPVKFGEAERTSGSTAPPPLPPLPPSPPSPPPGLPSGSSSHSTVTVLVLDDTVCAAWKSWFRSMISGKCTTAVTSTVPSPVGSCASGPLLLPLSPLSWFDQSSLTV